MKKKPMTLASATTGLIFLTAACASATTVIVSESFGGTSADLQGKNATIFATGITTLGGSSTWQADGAFNRDGTVVGTTDGSSAYLNLGSYINSARGTSAGQFTLTATFSAITAGSWLSLGFASENDPNIAKNFTDSPGVGNLPSTITTSTILRRASGGEIDGFVGPGSGGNVQGPATTSGPLTLSVLLNLTAWNGTSNYGTVTYSSGGTPFGGAQPLTSDTDDFGSILISQAGNAAGSYSNLTLTQVPEPASTALLGLFGFSLLILRRR